MFLFDLSLRPQKDFLSKGLVSVGRGVVRWTLREMVAEVEYCMLRGPLYGANSE